MRAPHLGGTGERHHVHVRGGHQSGRRLRPGAGDDVDHAVAEPGLGHRLAQQQHAQRVLGGGLDHHRVARSQRRSDLAGHVHQRHVVGGDAGHHPHRMAPDGGADQPGRAQSPLLCRHGRHVLVEVERTGVVAESVDHGPADLQALGDGGDRAGLGLHQPEPRGGPSAGSHRPGGPGGCCAPQDSEPAMRAGRRGPPGLRRRPGPRLLRGRGPPRCCRWDRRWGSSPRRDRPTPRLSGVFQARCTSMVASWLS